MECQRMERSPIMGEMQHVVKICLLGKSLFFFFHILTNQFQTMPMGGFLKFYNS